MLDQASAFSPQDRDASSNDDDLPEKRRRVMSSRLDEFVVTETIPMNRNRDTYRSHSPFSSDRRGHRPQSPFSSPNAARRSHTPAPRSPTPERRPKHGDVQGDRYYSRDDRQVHFSKNV